MSGSTRSRNYTLAGTPAWKAMQRNKPAYEYTRRDRDFIEQSMNAEWDPNLTGTTVEYIEPEGSEANFSMSSDEPEPTTSTAPTLPHIGPKKAKFKKMAKRLYPAKVVGGAKAIGGAIRHPMITGRKVNGFVRRKNAPKGHIVSGWDFPGPPLTRCATVSEREMCSQAQPSSPVKSARKGILRRRNSLPVSGQINIALDMDILMGKTKSQEPTQEHIGQMSPALPSPLPPRSASSLGLNSPRMRPQRNHNSPAADDELPSIPPPNRSPPSPDENLISALDEQIQHWTLSGTRGSQDSQSTLTQASQTTQPIISYASILRHQRTDSHDTVKSCSKQFTDAEVWYLNSVLETLYDIILDCALDKSGIQYRNTFAWRFHTDRVTEFDKDIGWKFGGKKFKIKDFINEFDFGGALLEKLDKEPTHRELGLRWSEISFVDRRLRIELSYTLSDDESD